MSSEWKPGLNNNIQGPILMETAEAIYAFGERAVVNLKDFNDPPLQASRSGILDVVGKANCLEVVRTRTRYGTVYEAVLAPEVLSNTTKKSLSQAIFGMCGSHLNQQIACVHNSNPGGCELRNTLKELEDEHELILQVENGQVNPSYELFETYKEALLAFPGGTWQLSSSIGDKLVDRLKEYTFDELYNSLLTDEQSYDLELDGSDEKWHESANAVITHFQILLQGAKLVGRNVEKLYGPKTDSILNQMDVIDIPVLQNTFHLLQRLYKFSNQLLRSSEGICWSEQYKQGNLDAYADFVNECFNYGLWELKIPEYILKDLFSNSGIQPEADPQKNRAGYGFETLKDDYSRLLDFYSNEYASYVKGENTGLTLYFLNRVAKAWELKDELLDVSSTVCITDLEGNISGWGSVTRMPGNRDYYVLDYYLGVEHRGKGLGYKLLEELVRHLKDDLKGNGVLINIKKENDPSRRTVEKLIREKGLLNTREERSTMYYYTIQLKS